MILKKNKRVKLIRIQNLLKMRLVMNQKMTLISQEMMRMMIRLLFRMMTLNLKLLVGMSWTKKQLRLIGNMLRKIMENQVSKNHQKEGNNSA